MKRLMIVLFTAIFFITCFISCNKSKDSFFDDGMQAATDANIKMLVNNGNPISITEIHYTKKLSSNGSFNSNGKLTLTPSGKSLKLYFKTDWRLIAEVYNSNTLISTTNGTWSVSKDSPTVLKTDIYLNKILELARDIDYTNIKTNSNYDIGSGAGPGLGYTNSIVGHLYSGSGIYEYTYDLSYRFTIQ